MNASIRLLEQVLPSTVHLTAAVPESHPSAAILGTERAGSGTLVDGGGLVLTTHYIVLGASRIEVTLLDGTACAATVAARDFATGLAVLRLAGGAGPAVTMRSSESLVPGQDVFLLSAAGDQARRAASGGVMSLGRFDALWEYSLPRAIATTAINPGLAGGALFDSLGHMRGIVSLDLADIGRFTLAVPVEHFLDHRDELLAHGRRTSRPPRAWLGFYCYVVGDRVVVAGTLPGTPAAGAGLQAGDVLLAVDGVATTSRALLYDYLSDQRPGSTVRCTVLRDEQLHELPVRAGDAEMFFA